MKQIFEFVIKPFKMIIKYEIKNAEIKLTKL